MLSHGKLDLCYFFGGAEKLCGFVAHICGRNRQRNNLPRVLEKYACLLQIHLLMQAIASANKQLLSVVM